MHNGQIHACGGSIEPGPKGFQECYQYDATNDKWNLFTKMPHLHWRFQSFFILIPYLYSRLNSSLGFIIISPNWQSYIDIIYKCQLLYAARPEPSTTMSYTWSMTTRTVKSTTSKTRLGDRCPPMPCPSTPLLLAWSLGETRSSFLEEPAPPLFRFSTSLQRW